MLTHIRRGLDSITTDLRFGFRQVARRPFSTLTMVVVLALGIGFNTGLFVLLSAFLYGPLPGVPSDESLVRIRGGDRNISRGFTVGREFSYAEYQEYAAQSRLFGSVAAWTSADVALDFGREEENLHSGAATYVTPNYFQVLGVRRLAGAGLPSDAADSAAPRLVAVISYVVWDRFYGKDEDVVGRTLKVNGHPVTIVGVAPRRFNGARTGGSLVRVWLPLNARSTVQRTPPGDHLGYDRPMFGLIARLQPSIEPGDTPPIVTAIAARASQQMPPRTGSAILSTDVVPLLADNYFPPSGEQQQSRILALALPLLPPMLVLAITCVTVSALQAGLAIARRREIAVRLALGASRRRLVRQLVTESVMLAFEAAALALFVIWALIRALKSTLTDLQMTVDVSSLALTGGFALGAGVLFGLSPALHATRLALADVLKDAGSALAPSRSRLQASLVVTQIALTQPALLAMGALFLEMVASLRDVPSAASADRILDVRFNTNPRYVTLDGRREETLLRLRTRFESVPGVEAVVAQENADAYLELTPHQADLVPGVEPRFPLTVRAHAAPAGYFSLMSIPLLLGRDFDRSGADGDAAVVVGADLARSLWGDIDPSGRRLTTVGLDYFVVGVVDDSRASGSGPNDWRVYVPAVRVTGHFLVRTQGPAQPLIPAMRSVANQEAPELSIVSARTLASIEEADRASFMRAIAATGGSAAVALLLSAIGLYAVVAVAVGQRVREIGIRTALGADGRRILAMFLRRGMSLSLAGVFVGLGLAFAGLRVMSALRGVEPAPGTTAIAPLVALLVTGVALLATWIPARRATRIDPLQALRLE